jgi:hypothetical protein
MKTLFRRKIFLVCALAGFLCINASAAFCGSSEAKENYEDRLRKGEAITEGGYLEKGVWGKLEGVVDVPPVIVWRLFFKPINGNATVFRS